MTNKRCGQICFRLGLVCAGLMAIFWGIWSVSAPVPKVAILHLTHKLTWTIHISRWWDVPLVFALVNVYGWVFQGICLFCPSFNLNKYNKADFISRLFLVLFTGLFVGLFAGLLLGPVYGLAAGSDVGLVYGLAAGFIMGCAFGLAVGLVASFVAGFAVLVKHLFFLKFWLKIGRWLIASDAK